MGIDIEKYTQPLKDASNKLKMNEGAAGQLQSNLNNAASSLSSSAGTVKGDAGKLRSQWSGGKGTTFEGKAGAAPKELENASNDASKIAKMVGSAVDKVKAAQKEVQQLTDEFRDKATKIAIAAEAAQGPSAAGIKLQAETLIQSMAAQYAQAAASIVAAAKGGLSSAGAGSTSTASSGPSSAGTIGGRSSGGGSGSGGSGGGGSGGGASSSGGGGGTDAASSGKAEIVAPPQNNYNDGGTKVKLPDGKEVDAPNPRAAAALRAALSRKGLPYKWGGTDPRTGLDCSGLTQWAYGQAGIKLPRTSAAQHVGEKIAPDQAQPGDLYVWKGHVAMYIGNNQIVEEPQPGDVCHIRPARTSNAGDAFLGVFRPSA